MRVGGVNFAATHPIFLLPSVLYSSTGVHELFLKEPESKYFRLLGHTLCHNSAVVVGPTDNS